MRALNRILFALLIVCLLGAMMPVAAATDSPNRSQWKLDWRFVSPKPRPGANDMLPGAVIPLFECQPAPLFRLIVHWLFGVVA
jgi:hypothetical protein